jgi:hypothetical protein
LPPFEFTVIVAVRCVRPVGVNFTAMLHADPTAMELPQVLVWLK